MKVLVQDLVTAAYFQSPGCWTPEPDEAFIFSDSQAAAQFCFANEIAHVQVVLKFEDDQYDVLLPVTEAAEVQHPGHPMAAA